MEDRLLKADQAGEWIGKSPASLAQWRYLGIGPKFIKAGRTIRYRESDIAAWLDAQTRQQTGGQVVA
ncbi:putative DNA-binding transcriptional regulator AlpA [Arthrobacter sp. CAN_A6]|uniref:helix-turn-helix transcriptional regulator n=1 Tax=Arthrobacter sp. CAN_A6 TaxID=2787721 RepID=UPI0018C9042C